MAKLSQIYRSRAQRVHRVSRAIQGAEAKVVYEGVKEGVQVELYERTPLKTTGRMLSSVQIRWLGAGFAIVYAAGVAPYGAIRAGKKGVSPSGGHLLNMDPAGYMRAKYGPSLLALKRRHQKEIGGRGATCTNGN